jgi:Rieske Fe-S protein
VTTGLDRRALLGRLAYGGALLAAGATSCGGPAATTTRVPLADLPAGSRRKVFVKGKPVELRRTEQGVAARSLLCSHTGCTVAWDEGKQRYFCPCHQGVYDANGAVVFGAPTAPLADVPVAVVGADIIVGT